MKEADDAGTFIRWQAHKDKFPGRSISSVSAQARALRQRGLRPLAPKGRKPPRAISKKDIDGYWSSIRQESERADKRFVPALLAQGGFVAYTEKLVKSQTTGRLILQLSYPLQVHPYGRNPSEVTR